MTISKEQEIRDSIVNKDYQPVTVIPPSSIVRIIAPLDKRSSPCSIVREIGQKKNAPQFIIIHGTTPGIDEDARLSGKDAYHISLCANEGTTWTYRNENHYKPTEGRKGGSGHYTVFKDGIISQHINETDPVKHCASYNLKSIGIEHHFIFGKEPPTKQMYEASAKLVRDIVSRYKMREGGRAYKDIVLPHDPTYDPGPYWDWGYYLKLLEDPDNAGDPRSKEQTEQNIGTDWKDPSLPSPNYGPRKEITPGTELPFYKKQQDVKIISDDDIENGILPFLIDDIMQHEIKNKFQFSSPFAKLNCGKASPFVNNLIFGKNITDYKNYNSLTNLELSNFVPFVELYIIKDDGEYMYPFDDYTSRSKIENIFEDKTGRGGAVGIKEVSFKSLATNQSNLAQQTVKISFVIQDIQEIEAEKNGISLLDFLYPAGSRDPTQHRKNNFNIRMKTGWKYKENIITSNVKNKISKDLLEETIFLSLFKHSFEFNEKDGTVVLDVEYIGMLETKLEDSVEHNIIDLVRYVENNEENKWRNTLNDFNRWNKKSEIAKNDSLYHTAKFDKPNAARGVLQTVKSFFATSSTVLVYDLEDTGKSFVGSLEEGLDKDDIEEIKKIIQEKIKQATTKDSAVTETVYSNLIRSIFAPKPGVGTVLQSNPQRMRYIHIERQEIEFLKSLASSNTPPSIEEFNKVKRIRSEAVQFAGVTNSSSVKQYGVMESSLTELSQDIQKGKKEKLDIKEMLSIMRKNVTVSEGDLFIPYVTVGDIIKTMYEKVYKYSGWNFAESPLRMIFGDFSYSISENLRPKNEHGGNVTENKELTAVNQEGKEILIYSPVKKYMNILSIPITIKSFDNWYRSNILDKEIKSMSFYQFIKKIMFELVPANLEPKIISWAPNFDFTPFLKLETSYKHKEYENNIKMLPTMDEKWFTDQTLMARNPFIKFYRLREKKESVDEKANYLFVFSKNEDSLSLRGDPLEDIERNIVHLYLGEETGLVKNIKFSREDNKQLDANNIVLANKQQGNPAIIRQIYQLKMRMFGNTIFSPGDLIHISPTYPGSRLPNSTLYSIGLGGYYFITKVNSLIEGSSFTTSIEGKWQASGKNNKNAEQYLELRGDEADIEDKSLDEQSEEAQRGLEQALQQTTDLIVRPKYSHYM